MPPKKAKSRAARLRLIERRKHPRFLLSGEQFKEAKSRRIFSVYDLSMTGFSMKVDTQHWPMGTAVQGVLNLHPESIDVSGRVVAYYGDRAAFKFEILSTYARTSLARSLSAARLGKSLLQVKEKLTVADFWFHGACNTDILIRVKPDGLPPAADGAAPVPVPLDVERIDIFYANYYCGWIGEHGKIFTGICQSMGREKQGGGMPSMSQEPVTLEALEVAHDAKPDAGKLEFALSILDASPLDPALKQTILDKFRS